MATLPVDEGGGAEKGKSGTGRQHGWERVNASDIMGTPKPHNESIGEKSVNRALLEMWFSSEMWLTLAAAILLLSLCLDIISSQIFLISVYLCSANLTSEGEMPALRV